MIRQFTLQNEYAQTYSLSLPGKTFLNEPQGLGYELNASYRLIGNSWVQDFKKDKQVAITGSVIFTPDDPYNTEAEFLRFIRTSKKLVLVYTTPAGTWMKDVDLISYQKTEIKEGNVLSCPITLMPKSLWYSNNRQAFSINLDLSEDAMIYPYRWPARFQSTVNGAITLTNDGSVDAPFTCVWNGPVVNPVLKLNVNGVEVAKCEITGEAHSGETINYSSRDGDLYVYHEASGVKTNLVSGLNINNNNFFKIPIGTSELKFSAAAQITQPIVVTIYKLYRAT